MNRNNNSTIHDPSSSKHLHSSSDKQDNNLLPIVVVGAGPAGLAVAASLILRGVKRTVTVLEAQKNSLGSWDSHFSNLKVTTQKRYCHLPGFPMSDKDFPGKTISSHQYGEYLRLYVDHFGIDVKYEKRVKHIAPVPGGDDHHDAAAPAARWVLECFFDEDDEEESTTIQAWTVIVATGKLRVPNWDPDLRATLTAAGINVVHSTEMQDATIWANATDAALNGKLCVVGLGNSSADILHAVLQSCDSSGGASTSSAAAAAASASPTIHVAARSVPPVFPIRPFNCCCRLDTMGSFVRLLPKKIQESILHLLLVIEPVNVACNKAFPRNIPRWKALNERFPTIDKYGTIHSALKSGVIIGHGVICDVSMNKEVSFQDGGHGDAGDRKSAVQHPMDMVVMATGYKNDDYLVPDEDRSNGLFLCGFGDPRLLPLKTMGEEATAIAKQIVGDLKNRLRKQQADNVPTGVEQHQVRAADQVVVPSQEDLDDTWCDNQV